MENWGSVVGIGVVAAIVGYLTSRKPHATRWQRIRHGLLIGLVAAVAGAGGAYLSRQLWGGGSDIDRAVQGTRELPLLRLVFDEHPQLVDKLRATAEDELRNPGRVPSPAIEFGAALRKQYLLPALQKSDDALAVRAAASLETLAKHLRTTNVSLCREFGLTGIQDARKLDRQGSTLLKEALAVQEDAYRSGKPGAPKPDLTDEQFAELLIAAGYNEADFQQLVNFEKLPPADACRATVKLYSAARALPQPGAGAVARRLLMAQ
jgi:hypothetical protein